jgi:hypothetical protein
MSPMTSTPATTRRPLPGSAFFIFTGQGNNGKTEQVFRLMTSRWPDGTPAIAPFLVLTVEASTEGTAAQFLADESMCLVWPVADFAEAREVLRTVFPEGRGPLTLREARAAKHRSDAAKAAAAKRAPPPAPAAVATDGLPVGGVLVDSASTLHRAQKTVVRETAREAKAGKTSVSGKDLENDQKRIAGIAVGPAQDFVDDLSSLAVRNRGVVVCVSVHTRAQFMAIKGEGGEAKDVVIGEAPDFGAPKTLSANIKASPYADLWNSLHTRANIVWHMFGEAPDFSAEADLSNVNAPGRDVTFGAVTMRGRYPGLGAVLWPKRQGGDGWLSEFDRVPRVWHPDVPWPLDDVTIDPQMRADMTPGHMDFDERTASLPGKRARGYDGSPDAGLVFELCLKNLAEKAGAR